MGSKSRKKKQRALDNAKNQEPPNSQRAAEQTEIEKTTSRNPFATGAPGEENITIIDISKLCPYCGYQCSCEEEAATETAPKPSNREQKGRQATLRSIEEEEAATETAPKLSKREQKERKAALRSMARRRLKGSSDTLPPWADAVSRSQTTRMRRRARQPEGYMVRASRLWERTGLTARDLYILGIVLVWIVDIWILGSRALANICPWWKAWKLQSGPGEAGFAASML